MPFSIQTNVNALVAQENLRVNSDFQSRTIGRLTSGYRINSSGDDAAGLAVANKYRSDTAELSQGVRNANDGLSQLQIIDGGLNNVAKILDRMKTLATQSASTTFTGDRTTLSNEYSTLLTEIDRQAANVGLGEASQGTGANRFNTKIGVYIGGGGDAQSNAKVSVDLSSASDRVSQNSLGLVGSNISGGVLSGDAGNVKNISTGAILAANATQDFTVYTANGSVSATVTGTLAGITGAQAVSQLNSQIASTGVTASIDTTSGQLKFSSDKTAFTVNIADASDPGEGLTSGAATVENAGMYKFAGDGGFEPVAGGTQTITVKVGTQQINIDLIATTTLNQAISQINAKTSAMGVYAVKTADGADFSFYSASSFKVSTADTAATAGWGTAVAAGLAEDGATAGSGVGQSATASAEAAITAITNAVGKLGVVQGKVGTGQNQLQYAINLAQSQISNFSAAESRIRDADVAAEAANLTKAQVLQQASLAAMAQANSAPQAVLALLRG
jgi:flagellin-like hook-associated protein FlgL